MTFSRDEPKLDSLNPAPPDAIAETMHQNSTNESILAYDASEESDVIEGVNRSSQEIQTILQTFHKDNERPLSGTQFKQLIAGTPRLDTILSANAQQESSNRLIIREEL